MKPIEDMTDEEFRSHALGIIGKEMGAYGLARFLRLTTASTGDYTRDRHEWLDGTTIEQVVERTKNRAT